MNKLLLAAAAILTTATAAFAADTADGKSDFQGAYIGAYAGYSGAVAAYNGYSSTAGLGFTYGGKLGYNFEPIDGLILGPVVDVMSIGDGSGVVGAASFLAGHDFNGVMPYMKIGVGFDSETAGLSFGGGVEVLLNEHVGIDIGYDALVYGVNGVAVGVGTARAGFTFRF